MKTIENYKVEIPTYALCYLVNDDASGLENNEIKAIDSYMQEYYDMAKKFNGHVIFSCGEGEGSFNHFPAFGLACETVECEILICK